MGRYNSDFTEPPWVFSPQAVEQWLEATSPGTKVRTSSGDEADTNHVQNVELLIDIDVERTPIPSSSTVLEWLKRHTGRATVMEHFELLPTTELLLRALHKAKFTNVIDLKFGDEMLYQGPERKFDITDVISLLAQKTQVAAQASTVGMTVRMERRTLPTARVTVRRIHAKKDHAIHIRFEGLLHKRLFHVFLNYLRDHLQVDIIEE
jgi:hypothetical protein